MSRFFFHIRDGDRWIEDPDGSDLPDLEAARAERLRAGAVLDGQRFEIADEAGTVLAVIPLRDVLRLP